MLATVTDKGQVTVPKNIRDQLHIEAGSKLDFEVEKDGSLRVRVLVRGADNLFGLVHRAGIKPLSVKEMLVREGFNNLEYHSPGVDASMAFGDDDVEAFRKVLPLAIDKFFLVLGRKTAAKGYQDVIDALDTLSGVQMPKIVMIGSDDDGVPIEHPSVIYLGRQPDDVVRGALRECLGLINMSRSESFGMVLLQAGLAAKPVLANRDCAAFEDIVADGVNGFLVSHNDLPARMLELASNKELRLTLGTKARKRALHYDWDEIERKFVTICDSLVNTR